MAKDKPKTGQKVETPFRRFEKLARRIVNAPKDKAQERNKQS